MRRLIPAAACLLALIAGADAQDYPSRPITMIVVFAPGGPTDVMARIAAEVVREAGIAPQ